MSYYTVSSGLQAASTIWLPAGKKQGGNRETELVRLMLPYSLEQ